MGESPSLECKDCGKQIEPRIVRRILAARRRGTKAPRLCKSCFLIRRGSRRPESLDRGKPLSVEEWECVKCGASLELDEVDQIRHGKSVECDYCGSTITRELFT